MGGGRLRRRAPPPPGGKFGTFNLRMVGARGAFKFYAPRVFAGMDVSNGGDRDATVTFASEGMPDVVVVVKAGELKRVRTGWVGAVSGVKVEVVGGDVRFDNLGWGMP